MSDSICFFQLRVFTICFFNCGCFLSVFSTAGVFYLFFKLRVFSICFLNSGCFLSVFSTAGDLNSRYGKIYSKYFFIFKCFKNWRIEVYRTCFPIFMIQVTKSQATKIQERKKWNGKKACRTLTLFMT